MELVFEWDKNKAKANIEKHTISFEEAATVFGDENSITIDDASHSEKEKRHITLGKSIYNNLLVVMHTDRGKNIRIISARKASRKERKQSE
jgi:uncharacterized DUF497 family protein